MGDSRDSGDAIEKGKKVRIVRIKIRQVAERIAKRIPAFINQRKSVYFFGKMWDPFVRIDLKGGNFFKKRTIT